MCRRRSKDRESGEEKKKATGDGRDEMAVRVASIHESGDKDARQSGGASFSSLSRQLWWKDLVNLSV